MAKIERNVSEVRDIAVEAHNMLIDEYNTKAAFFRRCTNITGHMQSNTSMEPIIMDLELNCPVAGKGKICDTCSSRWCQMCFGDTEPCSDCKLKKTKFSARVFCNLVLGAGVSINSVNKRSVIVNNGVYPRNVADDGLLIHSPHDDRIPLHFSVCSMSVI